jgi:hypothetical protein
MFGSDSRWVFALALAALCVSGQLGFAQDAGVAYSSWPLGFQSNLTVGQSANLYGSFAGFGRETRSFSQTRYNFSNGWFVGAASAPLDFGISGINRASAFGGGFSSDGMQFGYKFQNGLPLTVFGGVDTIKYNSGIGSPLAPFDSVSTTLPGYRAHAGVEFQAAPNLSLSLGASYTQAPARSDSDIFSFGRR